MALIHLHTFIFARVSEKLGRTVTSFVSVYCYDAGGLGDRWRQLIGATGC